MFFSAKLEGTHRVPTHAVLLLTLTVTLKTFQPKIMSLVGYPKVIPYIPSLNTLGSFVFELCCGQINRQTGGLENLTDADRHSRRGY